MPAKKTTKPKAVKKPKAKPAPEFWHIIDLENNRPYIAIDYPSKLIADRERGGLLRGFPPEHEWSKRLVVKQSPGALYKPEMAKKAAS